MIWQVSKYVYLGAILTVQFLFHCRMCRLYELPDVDLTAETGAISIDSCNSHLGSENSMHSLPDYDQLRMRLF